MKIASIALSILAALLLIYVLAAPIGPAPGFVIGGTETPVPSTWPDTSDVHEIRLKVPGFLPRVVIIWVIDYQGTLYVVGSPESGWTQMIGDASEVAMRLGDNTYKLMATRTNVDLATILTAYGEKYIEDYPDIVSSFPSVEEAVDQVAVFKLTAPSS